jgi:phage FluMu gp28-like protein
MSIVGDERSQLSLVLYLALFIDGFSLDLLSDELRKTSTQRIISDYFDFIEKFDEVSLMACSSGLFGIPVFILSAALQSSLQSL